MAGMDAHERKKERKMHAATTMGIAELLSCWPQRRKQVTSASADQVASIS